MSARESDMEIEQDGEVPTVILSAKPAAKGWNPRSYALIAPVAAGATICLKAAAYLLTGSVGFLSDAAESTINLVGAGAAVWMLSVAARPPDKEHTYGHSKAEYFSSGLESALILVAAIGIAWAALDRLMHPQYLTNVGVGLTFSAVATVLNGGVALTLLRAGRRLRSIALRADGQHLLTDVWTSLGVLLGVALASLTGLLFLDPLVALLVAANITWTGLRLLNDSALGLLDTALPTTEQQVIASILAGYEAKGIQFHAVRTRVAGQRRFVSMHVLVPGDWSVRRGHALCEHIEKEIIEALPMSTVFTHLEPLDDPLSWDDQELDRSSGQAAREN